MSYKPKIFTQASINAVFLTGILTFLMHPFVLFGYQFPDLGFLAWIHLVPLLVGIHCRSFKNKFLLCLLSSMVAYFGMFYWLIGAMQRFGSLSFFQAFGVMVLFCMILSSLYAAFLSLTSWVNHHVKLPLFILLPIFMVTQNFLLHHFPFGGLPWATVGYSQGSWLKFFQWVDHVGVLGLSFFIYLVNGLIADGILLFIHRKQLDKMVSRFLVVFILIFLSLYLSFVSSRHYEKTKVAIGDMTIALIQGNISQDIKWDPFKAQDNLNVYLANTNAAVKDGADLVVWPETAYPYGLRFYKLKTSHFLDKEELAAPILFGAIVSKDDEEGKKLLNSVVYADKFANMNQIYNKLHLVPFGEYMPFKTFTGFLSGLTQGVGEFDPGWEYTLFEINDIKFAPLICFEDLFPRYARTFSNMLADVLINFTNDGWYGDTSAQYQHVVTSQFRALENRRFLFRATNTGVTGIINPNGEIVNSLEPFTEGYLLQNVTIEKGDSFYTKHGHTWVYGMVVLCVLILLYAIIKNKLGPVKIEF